MCYPTGPRLAQRHILALDTLYQHLFSTPGCDTTTIDHLKHDLVLWLTHHGFEELPDTLEYYLADPTNRKISMIFPLVSCCGYVNNPSSS